MKWVSRMLGAAICAMGLANAVKAGDHHDAPMPKVYHGGGQHGGGKLIIVGGPHINVGGVNVYSGGMSANRAIPVSNANTYVTVYSGGGGSYVNYTKVPEYVDGLEVVTVTRGGGSRGTVVRADCIAEGGERMSAARTGHADVVTHGGANELFRCEAGLELHAYAAAEFHGDLARTSGQSFTCRPGQSLWSTPNGGLVCRAKRRLECSEAQLRHAYGVDAVILSARRHVEIEEVHVTRGLSLNGGVGWPPL